MEDTVVILRDGTLVATDVVRIDDHRQRPALLLRTPYSRASARRGDDLVELARHGWAVVVQDTRGRYDSEGTFNPFQQEGTDGADAIAWVAAQPWCDGHVIGYGRSYLGLAHWRAAATHPPALRAIAPILTSPAVRTSWIYEGGALQLGFLIPWAAQMAVSASETPPHVVNELTELMGDWSAAYSIPLAEHPLRRWFPPFDRWLNPSDEPYWRSLEGYGDRRRIDIPTFQIAGWYDLFCEGALASHGGMATHGPTERTRSRQRLIIGPWIHSGLYERSTAHFDFGPRADGLAIGIRDEMLGWLRNAADGEPVDGGIDAYVLGRDEWLQLPEWPPVAEQKPLFLSSEDGAQSRHGDGRLVAAPQASGTDTYRYDPYDPVPTWGGRTVSRVLPAAGPVDQRPVEERYDVLVYTSEPLESDLTILGQVDAKIVFATDGRSADVAVKLVDVWPDGRAYNIVDSVRRAPFEPGRPKEIEVNVGSTAACFRAGHRIRVEVSSSNFPRFDRNPSSGKAAQDTSKLQSAHQTVFHGGHRPSYIQLPCAAGTWFPEGRGTGEGLRYKL